jgi:hypothetical protein
MAKKSIRKKFEDEEHVNVEVLDKDFILGRQQEENLSCEAC